MFSENKILFEEENPVLLQRMTSKWIAHDVPACTFSQALDLNGGYIQRLNLGSCKAANGQPVDYYGFTLSADSLVLAVMTSSDVDGFLTLYDSVGNVVRTDDNSYGGIDPLLVLVTGPGEATDDLWATEVVLQGPVDQQVLALARDIGNRLEGAVEPLVQADGQRLDASGRRLVRGPGCHEMER